MGAVGELNSLLASKRALVVAQTNKRSAEIHEISKRNLFIATKNEESTGHALEGISRVEKITRAGFRDVNDRLDALREGKRPESRDDQFRELRAWLDSTPFHQADHKRNLRLKDPHTCKWALDRTTEIGRTIDGWFNGLDKENAFVWLAGKPA